MKINVRNILTQHETRFDTDNIDYTAIWKKMGMIDRNDRRNAYSVIRYFDKKQDEIMEIPDNLKGFGNYKKRSDLENIAGTEIVQMLIGKGVLEMHRRLRDSTTDHRQDPDALYRIDYMHLYEEMREIDPEFGEDWD
jgi:beta-N-acetylglucosaminidase